MNYINWIAKALAAMLVAFVAAAAQYALDLPPWVYVLVATALAGITVFLVPNGEKPVAD